MPDIHRAAAGSIPTAGLTRRHLFAGLGLFAAVACLGGCTTTSGGPAFQPRGETGQSTLYIYREQRSAFAGAMPLADLVRIEVNGRPQGMLGWGQHLRVVVPPGELSVVADQGDGARWAFGRTSYAFTAEAGAISYLRLEIQEKAPDELSPTVVRRNWASRFHATSADEAATHLRAAD